VIKALKEKERLNEIRRTNNDLESIVHTLKHYSNKRIKAIKLKRVAKSERRFGLLDSGATHNVREIKKDEDYEGLFPIEVEVAFDSEVKTELFMNRRGTIIGPEGTETILSMSEVVKAGYSVTWTEDQKIEVSKGDYILPVEVRHGTPVLPNELCLKMIEEIEEAKTAQIRSVKALEEGCQIKDIWPQLKKAINWLLKHGFEGATELLAKIVCRRKQERDIEEEKTEEQVKLLFQQVEKRDEAKEDSTIRSLLWRKQQAYISLQGKRRRSD
jgi:hypothetical protein